MPRLIRKPQGKNWQRRPRLPLFVRRHGARTAQAMMRRAYLLHMRIVAERHVPNIRRWSPKREKIVLSRGSDRAELPLILEIALAQGFKSAANRRRRHSCALTLPKASSREPSFPSRSAGSSKRSCGRRPAADRPVAGHAQQRADPLLGHHGSTVTHRRRVTDPVPAIPAPTRRRQPRERGVTCPVAPAAFLRRRPRRTAPQGSRG